MDETPPALDGEPAITPAAGRQGTLVSISFAVTEPLASDPKVQLAGRAMTLDEAGSDRAGLKYRFAYLVTGTEPEGAAAVTLDLVDVWGNATTGVAGGSVGLDFTAPSVVIAAPVSPANANASASVTVSLAFNEPLGSAPLVWISQPEGTDTSSWQLLAHDAAGTYTFGYTATGTETEAIWSVWVSASDVAGNEMLPLQVGDLALDFTAPGLAAAPPVEVHPAVAQVGRTVTVAIAANEPVRPVATLIARAGSSTIAFMASGAENTALGFMHTVVAGEDGRYDLWLEGLQDEAGNRADPVKVGTATIDGMPPQLTDVQVSPPRASALPGHDTVELRFRAQERLASLEVRMGDQVFDCATMPDGAGEAVQCAYTATGAEPEGVRFISVVASDAAGNSGIGTARVEFDFTAPAAIVTSQLTPTKARTGISVSATVRFNEVLAANPVVSMTSAIPGASARPWSLAGVDANGAYTYRYIPEGDEDEGAWTVSLSAADQAGNALTAFPVGGVLLDFTPPAVVTNPPVLVRPAFAPLARTVTVDVTATEPVLAGATLTARSEKSSVVFAPAEGALGFMHTVQAGEDAAYDLWLSGMKDEAGNLAPDVNVGSVVFDTMAPTITDVFVAPERCSAVPGFNELAVDFAISESLATLDVRLGEQPFQCTTTTQGTIRHAHCVYVVKGAEAEGTRFISILASDPAGNARSANPVALLDFTPPSAVVAEIPAPAMARKGVQIETRVKLNEKLSAAPAISMQRAGETARSWQLLRDDESGGYTFGYTPDGTEAEGSWTVSLRATDQGGNAMEPLPIGAVTLDFIPPAVATSPPVQIHPAIASVGRTVMVAIPATETVAPGATLTAHAGARTIPFAASGGSLGFQHTVGLGEDGTYELWLEGLKDVAGNIGASALVGSVTFDGTAPSITGVVVSPARCSAVAGFNHVQLTFHASEPLASHAVVLGENTIPCTLASEGVGAVANCEYVVTGSEEEGPQFISVSASDAAGNSGFASGRVELDFTAPRLVAGTAELRLSPPPGSLVTQVSALGRAGSARVLFSLDEPVGSDPSVRTTTPEILPFSRESGSTTSFVYGHVLSAGAHAQGAYSVEVVAVDGFGNSRTIVLPLAAPGLVVDTIAPQQLGPAQLAQLLYRRAPWGDAETSGVKWFGLRSMTTGTVEPGTTVIVWDDSSTSTASEIGRTTADSQGTFPELTLNRADRPAIFLSQVDGAGNLDAVVATRVRQVEWVASMGGKVAGSTLENPSTFVSRRWMGRALEVPMGALSGSFHVSGDPLALPGGAVAPVSGEGSYRLGSPAGGSPAQLYQFSMAHDVARNQIVAAVGCLIGYADTGETWLWNGLRWQKVTVSDPETDGNPFGYGDQVAAYDSARGHVLVYKRSNSTGEMWAWNGATWRRIVPDGDFPDGALFGMAYDSKRDRTVWFGGYMSNGQTWEWDGAMWQPFWSIPDPEGDGSPSGRAGFELAFDSKRAKTVLFGGGVAGGGAVTNETWEWDGTSWRSITPADPEGDGNPAARERYAMAFDSGRGRLVLFGGTNNYPSATSLFADTWEWDGASWRNITPTDPEADGNPTGRWGARMTYDAAQKRIVMLGGISGMGTGLDETWEWDGTSWRLRRPGSATNPTGQFATALAYDPRRARVVHFGGLASGSPSGETWEWDGTSWLKKTPTDPEGDGNPASRVVHAMVDGGAADQIVMFGGGASPNSSSATDFADLWTWNGTSWRSITPTDPEGDGNPAARQGHALAYDSARGQLVLFGGLVNNVDNGETWEWNGTSWRSITPADPEGDGNPVARRWHAMTFDSARGKVLLVGGYPRNDYWQWDGSSWAKLPTQDPEHDGGPYCHSHTMAYDSTRGNVVLFGGQCGDGNDTWEWNGSSWRRMTPVDNEGDGTPSARLRLGMTYDSGRQRMVLSGGNAADETWELDFGSDQSPGQVMSVPLGPANILPGSTLLSIQPSFIAGGSGQSSGASADGVALLGWFREDGWHQLAINSAPPGSPADVHLLLEQVADIERLQYQNGLTFAVVPRGRNGTWHASLATDYAEVRVRYELP